MTNRLFVQTNNPAGNQILVHERAEDGSLTLAETVDTGGVGGRNDGASSDPLASQGSLVYDAHHGVLIAVNAGSNTVSVLGLDDYHLCLRQVLASGGTFPVSVAIHGDLLYVVNAHEAGAITGYQITDGQFCPIQDSTRSLELTPVTGPGQFLNTPRPDRLHPRRTATDHHRETQRQPHRRLHHGHRRATLGHLRGQPRRRPHPLRFHLR
jgi:hypothetical protein